MPSRLSQFTLSISSSVLLTSVAQFCVWQMFPCVAFIVQSPFAPFPLQKLHHYYGLIRKSCSPVEFRFQLISTALIEQDAPNFDVWPFLRRLDPLSAGAPDFYTHFFYIRCISLPHERIKSASWTLLQTTSRKRFISVCSLRFMLRLPRLIDHWAVPTSFFFFKKRAVCPFTSELSY